MNIKKVLVAAVVIYAVISAWMIGTPYIKNAMFSNEIDNIARSLSVDGTVEGARGKLLEAVRLHEVPATEEGFTVIRDPETRQIFIEVRYTVEVTTPFDLYTHVWNFAPRAEYGLQKLPTPGR